MCSLARKRAFFYMCSLIQQDEHTDFPQKMLRYLILQALFTHIIQHFLLECNLSDENMTLDFKFNCPNFLPLQEGLGQNGLQIGHGYDSA